MKKSEAIERWNDWKYSTGMKATLERAIVAKKLVCGIDLGGIVIGRLDGALSGV